MRLKIYLNLKSEDLKKFIIYRIGIISVESINEFKNLEILSKKQLGSLAWIEYRNLKDGAKAFKDIHDGSCSATKIVLLI